MLCLFQFLCSECGKTYTTGKILNAHKKLQHGKTKPQYLCPLPRNSCGKTCTTPYNLVQHMVDKHKLEMNIDEAKRCFKPINKPKLGKIIVFFY